MFSLFPSGHWEFTSAFTTVFLCCLVVFHFSFILLLFSKVKCGACTVLEFLVCVCVGGIGTLTGVNYSASGVNCSLSPRTPHPL